MLSSGPLPLCVSTGLLRPLLLNLGLLEVTSYQQYVLLHRHNICVHLNSSLNRPGSLLSCFFCVLHNMLQGRNLLPHQQWNYRHSHLIATCAIQLSFQVLYNIPVLSRQEQDTANLCPLLTLRNCLHHKIWWRSCSTAPTFATLRNEEWRTRQWLVLCVQFQLWRVQLRTMICSYNLASWTVYY